MRKNKMIIRSICVIFAFFVVGTFSGCGKSAEEIDKENAVSVQRELNIALEAVANGGTGEYNLDITLQQLIDKKSLNVECNSANCEMFFGKKTRDIVVQKLYPDNTYVLLKMYLDKPISELL